MNNRALLEKIKSVDSLYSKALDGCNDLALKDIESIAASWEENLKAIFYEDMEPMEDAGKQSVLDDLIAEYPDEYISPVFKAKIARIQDIEFSRGIDLRDIKSLHKKLTTYGTSSSIERAVREFRLSFINESGLHYSIEKAFKPRHPMIYRLRDSLGKSYTIKSEKIVTSLNSILQYPNFHNSSTVLFSLAASSGLGLIDTADLHAPEEIGPHVISYKQSKKSRLRIERSTICKAADFCLAHSYLAFQKIGKEYAKAIDNSIPETALGLQSFSFKTIPALHATLCNHFGISIHDAQEGLYSRFQFIVEGTHKLDEAHKYSDQHFQARLLLLMGSHNSQIETVLQCIANNPNQKATAKKIMEWLSCSLDTAQQVQRAIHIKAVFQHVKQEPNQKVTVRKIMQWLTCSPKTAQGVQKFILHAISREAL